MSELPGDLDLPDALTIDPVTIDRMARQLTSSPESVVGVVAAVDDLPAGASTRTHAEWRSLAPLDRTTDIDAGSPGAAPEGAVLRRRGVAPGGGVLRVDPGAVAHRRSIPAAPDEDAGPEGRSPFPWRPVVLFLALADPATGAPSPPPTPGLLDGLIDSLLDADVEARLAAPVSGTAERRHRPCAPTAATVERLAPDVLVALDRVALEEGPAWCTRRGTIVVDMTDPAIEGVELVPWRIGTHPGRLRARVAPSVEPATLATLVNRLAAGPQPEPPRSDPPTAEGDADPGHEIPVVVRADATAARRIAVIGPSGRPLLDGLADRAAAAGHRVERGPADAGTADVVLVAAEVLDGSTDPLADLLAGRATAGRPTVAVVEVGVGQDGASALLAADPAGDLVVVSSDVEVIDGLRRAGTPTQLVPTMTTTDRRETLRTAGAGPVTPSEDVIGWTLLGAGDAPSPDDTAVAAALVALLDERPGMTVQITGAAGRVPEALLGRPDVTIGPGEPDPGEQARRRVHLLTTTADVAPAAVERVLVESGHLGVPTLLSLATARTVGGLADPRLVVPAAPDGGAATPAAWTDLLRRLLDGVDGDRVGRSAHARAVADALDGPAASDLVVGRLLGWLDRRGRR